MEAPSRPARSPRCAGGSDAAVHYDAPRRRAQDDSELARVTGYSNVRSLVVNVIGGLTISCVVGAISIWGTQIVLGEQISALSRQLAAMREEIREMRRDLYQPRWRGRESDTAFRWRPIRAQPPPPGEAAP